MNLAEDNIHGGKIAEFNFISSGKIDDIRPFIFKTLSILSETLLFFPNEGESTLSNGKFKLASLGDVLRTDLLNNDNYARGFIYGTGEIIGEGIYNNPIYLSWLQSDQVASVSIIVKATNWLEYDMEGKKQPLYQENRERLENALNYLKERVFKESEGWFLDIEPTVYSSPTSDGSFIRNNIDEDTGKPENTERIFGPLKYDPPLTTKEFPK